jgi:WD40 repeat protein
MMHDDLSSKTHILLALLIAPLQLYCSSLAFSPMQSIVKRIFRDEIPEQILVLPQVERSWGPQMQTLEGHLGPVMSVAFSGDGQMLASGSDDDTIKLWDTKTGAELHTLKGHSDQVTSVAFSSDGQMLASGSGDHTIKLWDAKTGAELQTLKGHTDQITSVAFSDDGQMLASGSGDRSIKLWDAKTGTELKPLANSLYVEGHTSNKSSSIPQLHDSSSSTISPQLSVSDNWVALRGQNFLWLPPEYRHFRCSALKDANLALGYSDGRVSILGFYTR